MMTGLSKVSTQPEIIDDLEAIFEAGYIVFLPNGHIDLSPEYRQTLATQKDEQLHLVKRPVRRVEVVGKS